MPFLLAMCAPKSALVYEHLISEVDAVLHYYSHPDETSIEISKGQFRQYISVWFLSASTTEMALPWKFYS